MGKLVLKRFTSQKTGDNIIRDEVFPLA